MATRITPFPKGNRNAGTYSSPVVAVPVEPNRYTLISDLNAGDLSDATLTLTITVWVSFDTIDGPFIPLIGPNTWHGGLDSEGLPQTNINLAYSSTNTMAKFVWVELTQNKRINAGFTVDVG